MTLFEWCTEKIEHIEEFYEFWKPRNAKRPEEFPDTLESGDWDEQFSVFCEAHYDSGTEESS